MTSTRFARFLAGLGRGTSRKAQDMPEIIKDPNYATFINTFRCEPANQDEVVRINMDIVDQVASKLPGFVSATIHRSVDGTRVINYLQWESADALDAMQKSAEFQAIARRFAGIIEFDPHECKVIHVAEKSRTRDRRLSSSA
jgi:quinol monooxygenase YgiN